METLRFAALYSTQIRRKKKVWKDGEAVYNPRKCRLTLKDEKGVSLESHWVYKQPRQGDEIMFEGHVVQIEHILELLEASQPVIVRTTPMAPMMESEPEDSLQRVLEASERAAAAALATPARVDRVQARVARTHPAPPLAPAPVTSSPEVILEVKRPRVAIPESVDRHSHSPKETTLGAAARAAQGASRPADTHAAPRPHGGAPGSPLDLRIEDETVLSVHFSSRPNSREGEEQPGSDAGSPGSPSDLPGSITLTQDDSTPHTRKVPSPEPSLQFPVFSDPRKQPSLSDLLGPSKQTHSLQHTAESLRARNESASVESIDCEIIYSRKRRTEWLRDVPHEHEQPAQGAWTWEAYWLVPWRPIAIKEEAAN